MSAINSVFDAHESFRLLRHTERSVDQHSFASVESAATRTVISETVEGGLGVSARKGLRQALKESAGAGLKTTYLTLKESPFFRGTMKYTLIGTSAVGVSALGIWVFTRAISLSLGWVEDAGDDAADYATKNPLAAVGIGLGMLMAVGAVVVLLFRRVGGK